MRGPQDASRKPVANIRLQRNPPCKFFRARHVKPEELLRLGVVSGWYSTKVSGTFVTGPHATQEDCLSKIAELNPAPAKKKF